MKLVDKFTQLQISAKWATDVFSFIGVAISLVFNLCQFLHARSVLMSLFCDFLSSCMHQINIPNIWRRALIVAIPKPEKPLGDPKNYRPISLLCVPFEILERLIYAGVNPIIDPLLPQEQAGFQPREVDRRPRRHADTGHRG